MGASRGHIVMTNDTTDEVAIRVEHVSKSFKLPHNKQNSLKGGLINLFNGERSYEIQDVLKDVSLEIKKGEFFGVVGRNGSGKSTLLKMLSGIYTPSEGKIIINGSLTPFIELGVGFNPELTGRENVYMNGALLGFNRNQMSKMYNDIVAFAELERFMDQKLKNYSSGMQVRLAFSIAIRANSDILILDEVLAVGDAAFQQKCNDYFEQQKAAGQTIVLVTHDMGSVEKYCSRAMLIEDGVIIEQGDPEKVANRYTQSNQLQIERETQKSNQIGQSGVDIAILDDTGKTRSSFQIGEEVTLRLKWENQDVENIGIAVKKQTGERMFAANTQDDKITIKGNSCEYRLSLNLGPGRYFFRIRLYGKSDLETRVLVEEGPSILVKQPTGKKINGLVYLPHTWKSKE